MAQNKSSQKSQADTLVERTFQAFKKEYVLVGKAHVRAWQAWLILGIVFGAIGAVVLVANRSGRFTSSDATAGFWQVSGTRFLNPAGRPSWIHGMNFDIDWMASAGAGDFATIQQFLNDAKQLGVRIIRVFPEAPISGDIEKQGIGVYNPAWFDGMRFILDFARQNNMYVHVIFVKGPGYYTGTPYAGQLMNQPAFFSSPEVRSALKQRLKAMASPFVNDPAIFAWTILTEPEFKVDTVTGISTFSPDVYADFTIDLSSFLRNEVGVKQLMTDGAMMDDVIRSGIPAKYPAFVSFVDFFTKHQYDTAEGGIEGITQWENSLMAGANLLKPWFFEELGHKDDDGFADGNPPTYSDAENALYFQKLLSFLKTTGTGVMLWNIYGPHEYAINPRFTAKTAEVVVGAYMEVPILLSPTDGTIFSATTTSVVLQWAPFAGARGYGVRVQDLTDANAKDPRSNCANTSGLYFCSDNYSTASLSIPIVAGHSYRWWIHAIESTGWWTDASSAGFSVSMSGADTTSPSVFITSPVNGSTVKRFSSVTINGSASDNIGITKVEFYVNNSMMCTDTTVLYTCSWRVPSKRGVTYQLRAKAYDAVGNSSFSSVVSVTSR
ncbi:MAG: Ig-like domain-containing protein [bacterium]|nr:Ig-like domain-containing protein [bacterium]